MAFSDELLRCFASVLKEAFPNALSCARMGGDEFTVILPAMHEARRNAAFLHLYKLMDEQNKKIRHCVSAQQSGMSVEVNLAKR